jgi:hypothetical protein
LLIYSKWIFEELKNIFKKERERERKRERERERERERKRTKNEMECLELEKSTHTVRISVLIRHAAWYDLCATCLLILKTLRVDTLFF